MLGAATATAALALIVPTQAMAAEVAPTTTQDARGYADLANYCGKAQDQTTGLARNAVTVVVKQYTTSPELVAVDPTGFDAFKKSKPTIDTTSNTVTVSQLVVNDAAGAPAQVLCKLKDRAALEQAFGPAIFDADTVQQECSAISKSVRRIALNELELDKKVVKSTTVIDPTVYAAGGNSWAVLGAFQNITDDGTLTHFRSHALVTSNDPNLVLPNATIDALNAQFGRFLPAPLPYGTTQGDLVRAGLLDAGILGTQYCTTPTVEAAKAALAA
jgi:hypothetical protein